jgi:nucleoside-diphosphate-sugar epimerase
MLKVLVTGASGFIGKNLIVNLGSLYQFVNLRRGEDINEIKEFDAIIHLAGLAHDLKNTNKSQDYYRVNTNLTNKIFDNFIASDASVFITLSSVKAVADKVVGELSEDCSPNPITDYGKSKLLAEKYILSKNLPKGKRVYILRPCMVHGTGNKGNLNLLHQIVSKKIPWPLGAFDNKRSFCSIDNLTFVINELISRDDIPSGIYNVADDEPLATNQIIELIAQSKGVKTKIYNIPPHFINTIAKLGDVLMLPLNSERLQKLTDSYVVSNSKLKKALAKPLPLSSSEGLLKTFKFFNQRAH